MQGLPRVCTLTDMHPAPLPADCRRSWPCGLADAWRQLHCSWVWACSTLAWLQPQPGACTTAQLPSRWSQLRAAEVRGGSRSGSSIAKAGLQWIWRNGVT